MKIKAFNSRWPTFQIFIIDEQRQVCTTASYAVHYMKFQSASAVMRWLYGHADSWVIEHDKQFPEGTPEVMVMMKPQPVIS